MNTRKMSTALLVSLLTSNSHGQSESRTPECMPGFNATLAKVYAIQRAHGCSLTGKLSECTVQMGLGLTATAIAGAAAVHASGIGSKIASSIRDQKFRPCPFKIGRNRYPLFAFPMAYAEGCTPRLEIDRARIQSAIEVVGQDLAERKKQASAALKLVERIDTELDTLSGPARDAKLKEVMEVSEKKSLQAMKGAEAAVNTAQMNLDWNRHAKSLHKAEDEIAVATRQLGDKFKRIFGYKMGDEIYNLREMAARLPTYQRTDIIVSLDQLRTLSSARIQASQALDEIERDPEVRRLTATFDAADAEYRTIRDLARNPDRYATAIHSNASQLRASMAELAKAESALADFKAVTAGAKNSEDLYAVASRLHNFIPKESLLDPAKSAIATTFKELASMVEHLTAAREQMSDIASQLLAKWPRLAEITAGIRSSGALAAKGVAFAGGAFATTLTFARNEFDRSCGDMPKSSIFPRDPNKGCAQELSPDNPVVQKIFEMNPPEMCELMKSNPEVKAMVDENYSNAYPSARAQCGNPISISMDGFAQIRYDGKTAEILEAGDRTAAVVQFDEKGIERGLKFPKRIRSGGTEQLAWNQYPSSGSEHFERFSRIYATRVLPALAEAQACCSRVGLSPSDAECARLGIGPAMRRTESGSSPIKQ